MTFVSEVIAGAQPKYGYSLQLALLHVPVAKHPSEQLEEKLLNGLSYATEKLAELTTLKEGLTKGAAKLKPPSMKQSKHFLL
ncbi:hypothetical protein ACEQPO_10400 [Bacillus sp. SL00103]